MRTRNRDLETVYSAYQRIKAGADIDCVMRETMLAMLADDERRVLGIVRQMKRATSQHVAFALSTRDRPRSITYASTMLKKLHELGFLSRGEIHDAVGRAYVYTLTTEDAS